jgi:hypothetical protein
MRSSLTCVESYIMGVHRATSPAWSAMVSNFHQYFAHSLNILLLIIYMYMSSCMCVCTLGVWCVAGAVLAWSVIFPLFFTQLLCQGLFWLFISSVWRRICVCRLSFKCFQHTHRCITNIKTKHVDIHTHTYIHTHRRCRSSRGSPVMFINHVQTDTCIHSHTHQGWLLVLPAQPIHTHILSTYTHRLFLILVPVRRAMNTVDPLGMPFTPYPQVKIDVCCDSAHESGHVCVVCVSTVWLRLENSRHKRIDTHA